MKKHLLSPTLLSISFALLFLLASCIKEERPTGPNEYVNYWIHKEMKTYYFWNDQIPSSPDYSLNPEPFFESILYKRGEVTGDRFSWIQENYLELLQMLNGITPYDIGFEYVGYLKAEGSTEVLAQIAYVKPNTNAESIGLKRGDFFTKVNGTTLNTTNWKSLLSDEGVATITFVNTNTGVTTDKVVTKHANYAEDPVFYHNIYEDNGHTIGYLVYNFFASGTNSSYDKKLNEVFGLFNNAGITELVLDLRYNSGGSMNSALLLGSMIVPGLNTNNVFTKTQFNSSLEAALVKEYGQDFLIDKFQNKLSSGETLNNVGNTIQKLYVLTGNWTASASELVINGLLPYMPGNIFLIGSTTAGKNLGSFSIYEENDPKNKWGMQPIVLRYFNKDGTSDFLYGFVPDIEDKDNGEKLPLGDPDERMLKKAIDHITGKYLPTKAGYSDSQWQTIGSSLEEKAWTNRAITDGSFLKSLHID